jgi:hypothetical protein
MSRPPHYKTTPTTLIIIIIIIINQFFIIIIIINRTEIVQSFSRTSLACHISTYVAMIERCRDSVLKLLPKYNGHLL